jgi:hypothetical protein
VVAGAPPRVAKDSKKVHDYADREQRYLVLRQRGSRFGWFVRGKRRMKRIGNAKKEPGGPDFLDVRKVRQKAGEQYYTMEPGSALKLSGEPLWTGADLDREYQASLTLLRMKGNRIKRPSQATQDDVRLCFDKPEFAAWREIKIIELTPWHLIKLLPGPPRSGVRQGRPELSAFGKDPRKRACGHVALVGQHPAPAADRGGNRTDGSSPAGARGRQAGLHCRIPG